MLKTTLFIISAVFVLIFAAFIVMAVMSQKTPKSLGLVDGLLKPCPDSPNCVCSEKHTKENQQHYISPLVADLEKVKHVILQLGGKIASEDDNYVHAKFTSSLFHYVDDVELRFEPETGITHVRSASRMGHSDLGANRKRVEAIKKAL